MRRVISRLPSSAQIKLIKVYLIICDIEIIRLEVLRFYYHHLFCFSLVFTDSSLLGMG